MTGKVLFVCTGNTCRSVMAEFLLNRMAPGRGMTLTARSCGVAAERYFQVPAGVRAALQAEGITKVDHVPQLVSRELLAWADLVLTMEHMHQEMVLDQYPESRAKVHILKTYAGLPGSQDVADPIGKPDQIYAACCSEIKESLEVILAQGSMATNKRAEGRG